MRATIEAGAEIEFATPTEVREAIRDALPHAPLRLHVKGHGIMPSSGLLVVELGAPVTGRVWDVRHVSVCAADPSQTVSGKGFICVGLIPPDQRLGLDPLDPFTVWTATNMLPADAQFDRNECIVRATQMLSVVFSGVSAGTQMAAHAQVVDEREYEDTVYVA